MWILMDIGCLLTGQLSRVVGRFENFSDARKIQKECEEKYGIPSQGKHKFFIFLEPELETANEHHNWLLMKIGCLSSGKTSKVVGRFEKLSDAQRMRHEHEEKYGIPSQGKHKFYVFPEPEPEIIHERYF